MRFMIARPGRVPLRNTLFSRVEVPDLRALAACGPEARTILDGAGPVPELLHRALIALGLAGAMRFLPLAAAARHSPIHFVSTMRLGRASRRHVSSSQGSVRAACR